MRSRDDSENWSVEALKGVSCQSEKPFGPPLVESITSLGSPLLDSKNGERSSDCLRPLIWLLSLGNGTAAQFVG